MEGLLCRMVHRAEELEEQSSVVLILCPEMDGSCQMCQYILKSQLLGKLRLEDRKFASSLGNITISCPSHQNNSEVSTLNVLQR